MTRAARHRRSSLALARALAVAASLCAAARGGDAGLDLPDPLRCADGTTVTTRDAWERVRRPETLRLFQDHVYGRQTVGRPARMTFAVVRRDASAMGGAATLSIVEIRIRNDRDTDGLTIALTMFVPNAVAKPAPAFVLINNRPASNVDPTRARRSPFWPAEEVVARGYAIAAFQNADADPDTNDFANGVHRVFDGGARVDDGSWGALAAWSVGASRVMDYLETDADIDLTQVAVVGHSRGGKAALVTAAYDQRYYFPVSNCSGESGAALARRKLGESIADITGKFPHWFCRRYATYAGRPEALPVDQHQLIALVAPRPVYVASASEDAWADPMGEFLSLVHARPVYALYGAVGIGAAAWPGPDTPVRGDLAGYHVHTGAHDLTVYDWQRFMDFFDHLRASAARAAK